MKAMILAAGLGKRLRPLTEHTPKPLLEIRGKPMIVYHIEALQKAGIFDIVINTSWLGEKLEAYLGDGSRYGVRLQWSRETTPLETGGGIRFALPLLGDQPFLLVNGDVWTDYPFAQLVSRQLDNGCLGHLVLVVNPSHNAKGDFCLEGVTKAGGVVARNDGVLPAYTFSGLSLIHPDLLSALELGQVAPLRDALYPALECGRIRGELYRGNWCDVGTLDRLNAANQA